MKYADFTRGYTFQLDGETYTATDTPSNNGNFKATDSRGALIWLNVAEVIRRAEYQHPSHDDSGRKICRKCGQIITAGENGAEMLPECFQCTPPPRYPKPYTPINNEFAPDYELLITYDNGDY